MKLLFEKSRPGRALSILPKLDVPDVPVEAAFRRENDARLPQLSEVELSRHYTGLAKRAFGVNDGFYPLGSCTMKYNPKVNEEAAALDGFTGAHPLAGDENTQGALEAMYVLEESLKRVTGMDAVTLQPAAGAHGEFTGLLLIKAYHAHRGDLKRVKILVPDSAHGTNPASAAMCGFTVVSIPSNAEGCVDLDALKVACGDDVAALMLTNPNTLGVFDKNILEITHIVHEAGGLNYYDGANLNAVMGVARPGDMGFDVVHLNLHKTFSTPHGGGGPGSGPVGCKAPLAQFLPKGQVTLENGRYVSFDPENSIGRVKEFRGNFLVAVKALTYILTLGGEGLREASQMAVLNANYMKSCLEDIFDVAAKGYCMHEFVLSLEKLKHETGVSAMDVAKGLLDEGMHPPTMYFPLIVHEALMPEPTETESKEILDEAVAAFRMLYDRAHTDPASLHAAPLTTVIGRPDDVRAARTPVLRAPQS